MPGTLEIVFVVEESDYELFQSRLPARFKLIKEPKILKDGHIQQKYSKLHADIYCKGDYIFHLDSDVLVTKFVEEQDLFWNGKPILEYDLYTNMPPPVSVWRSGTAKAIGLDDVAYEFSRKNQHLYPRQAYSLLRQHMERVHNVTFVEYLNTTEGHAGFAMNGRPMFSDFNAMGAFLYYVRPDMVFWVPHDKRERQERLDPLPVKVKRVVCQGNGRNDVSPCDDECGQEFCKIHFGV